MAIHEVFIYLRAKSAEQAVAFYKEAFGATEKFRLTEPGGRIGHVELVLGGTTIMLSDEFPECGISAPSPQSPALVSIHLHVDDADAVMTQAVAAGAEVIRPAADHFYGERSGALRDPFGYDWLIGSSIEEVSPEEMQRRYTAMLSGD
ncbi:VOC family protein [Pelagibius sp. CAU 1746]|uniref:VOC family protein n=1 Tax=Pelagibius sp. CAU 1746 TaxID=3140370 RepID=UPI00325A686A